MVGLLRLDVLDGSDGGDSYRKHAGQENNVDGNKDAPWVTGVSSEILASSSWFGMPALCW